MTKNIDKRNGKWWGSTHKEEGYNGPYETREEAIEVTANNLWPHEGIIYVGKGEYPRPSDFIYADMDVLLERMEECFGDDSQVFEAKAGADNALQEILTEWADRWIKNVDLVTIPHAEAIEIKEDSKFLESLKTTTK